MEKFGRAIDILFNYAVAFVVYFILWATVAYNFPDRWYIGNNVESQVILAMYFVLAIGHYGYTIIRHKLLGASTE